MDRGGFTGVSNWDKAEAVTDVAGCFTPLGDVAAIAINGIQGDLRGVVSSGLGVLPGGDIAKVGKYASKVDNIVGGTKGFNSFKSLKKYLGSPGEGNEWHHVVEECQIEKSGFNATSIHNPGNVLAVDKATHIEINAYYNSADPMVSGKIRVRDWLAGQSIEYQYEFGLRILKKHGY